MNTTTTTVDDAGVAADAQQKAALPAGWTRLVCFLGMGPSPTPPHYGMGRYELDGTHATATPLVEVAIAERLSVKSMVVLGTKEVESRWFGEEKCFEEHLGATLSGGRHHFRQVPSGGDREELNDVFDAVREALDPRPKAELGETTAPTEIVLDVTHGFRIQPIFGLTALSFVLSEWARTLEPDERPRLRVLYGAWEARKPSAPDPRPALAEVAPSHDDPPSVPIWDLTDFVTMARWSAAVDALMRYGRADDFEALAKEQNQRDIEAARARGIQGAALKDYQAAGDVGKAAKRFADDLATCRLRDLLTTSAPMLVQRLREERTVALCERLPALRAPLADLEKMVAPLCAKTPVLGWGGLRATAELVIVVGNLQRFSEQAVLIREGLVTHYGLLSRLPMADPGEQDCSATRAAVEQAWNEECRRFLEDRSSFSGVLHDNMQLSTGTQELRNDLEHAGVRSQLLDANGVRKGLIKRAQEFYELVMNSAPSAVV